LSRGQDEWDVLQAQLVQPSPLTSMLKNYVVIVLPLSDLPALSSLWHTPQYQLPQNSSPAFIVARADGEALDVFAGFQSTEEMTVRLGMGVAKSLSRDTPKEPTIVSNNVRTAQLTLDAISRESASQMTRMAAKRVAMDLAQKQRMLQGVQRSRN